MIRLFLRGTPLESGTLFAPAFGTFSHAPRQLSKWLTVPVIFDSLIFDSIVDLFGQAEAVQARWGSDIRMLYDSALRAAHDLSLIENPVREKLRSIIGDLQSHVKSFKIYCHRRARSHFESIFSHTGDSQLSNNTFLHSVKDYREAEPFDILIKFGPLRSRGWGAAPDALLTAPRFETLVQIVWSGCGDDPDFGYDPVSPPENANVAGETSTVAATQTGWRPVKWSARVTLSGEDPGAATGYAAEADELLVFRGVRQRREKRTAKLIQVDEEHGILYPPHSQALSFNPDSTTSEPIARRIPGETLGEGMFLIMPVMDEVDLGGLQAEHGHYSKIWKAQLEMEWKADSQGLIRRLKDAGLDLVHLNAAIKHWCQPPSTVIHAPQQIKHFRVLLHVLDLDDGERNNQSHKEAQFWQLAWNEVRRSRGEAIQAGFQEQEIVEDQLLVILRKLLPLIRERALANEGFNMALPPNNEIKGVVLFLKVCGVEDGFSAPVTEFKIIHELDIIDQWRD